jgi:hypothetical protein
VAFFYGNPGLLRVSLLGPLRAKLNLNWALAFFYAVHFDKLSKKL